MRLLRTLLGLTAIAALLTALNLMILRESVFTQGVLIAQGVFAVSGLLWFLLYLYQTLRSQHRDAAPYAFNALIASAAVLLSVIMVYLFVKRADLSMDLTREGRQDLAPQTIQVLESLTEPVDVYCIWVKAGDGQIRLAQEKALLFLERCQEYTDLLNIEVLDSQKDVVRMEALDVLRIQNVGTVVLKSRSRKKEIPLAQVSVRLEERDFTNALINVSRNEIPKLYFLDGHGGRDMSSEDPVHGGHLFKRLLEREAYEVKTLLMSQQNASIPTDCSVLVINNYVSDLKEFEIRALDAYLESGGRILMLLNPAVRIDEEGIVAQERLRPWLLSRLGVDVQDDMVVSEITGGPQLMLLTDFSQVGQYPDKSPSKVEFRGSYHSTHPITRNIASVIQLQFARSVVMSEPLPDRVAGTQLLRSTPDTWGETDLERFTTDGFLKRDGYEVSGPNSLGVAMTYSTDNVTMEGERSRDGRVVVIGDYDSTSNQQIVDINTAELLLNSVAWLTESEDLIAIRPRGDEAEVLYLTVSEQRMVVWLAVLGTVQLIVVVGVGTLLYRRRYHA